MRKHMDRRFDKMKKEAGFKSMSAGILIRVILLVALIFSVKFVCQKGLEKSIDYYGTEERSYINE